MSCVTSSIHDVRFFILPVSLDADRGHHIMIKFSICFVFLTIAFPLIARSPRPPGHWPRKRELYFCHHTGIFCTSPTKKPYEEFV